MRFCVFVFFLLNVVIVLPAVAQKADVQIDFVRVNNLGIRQGDHLKISKDRVQVGVTILKSEEDLKIAAWIESYKSISNKDTCAAGTFEVAKRTGKSTSVEKGCAEGVAYRELLQQFQRLNSLAKKEPHRGS